MATFNKIVNVNFGQKGSKFNEFEVIEFVTCNSPIVASCQFLILTPQLFFIGVHFRVYTVHRKDKISEMFWSKIFNLWFIKPAVLNDFMSHKFV